MNRRDFIKVVGLGAVTFYLSGCDRCGMDGDCIFNDAAQRQKIYDNLDGVEYCRLDYGGVEKSL